jgi:hypothetical protein
VIGRALALYTKAPAAYLARAHRIVERRFALLERLRGGLLEGRPEAPRPGARVARAGV